MCLKKLLTKKTIKTTTRERLGETSACMPGPASHKYIIYSLRKFSSGTENQLGKAKGARLEEKLFETENQRGFGAGLQLLSYTILHMTYFARRRLGSKIKKRPLDVVSSLCSFSLNPSIYFLYSLFGLQSLLYAANIALHSTLTQMGKKSCLLVTLAEHHCSLNPGK